MVLLALLALLVLLELLKLLVLLELLKLSLLLVIFTRCGPRRRRERKQFQATTFTMS